MVPFQLFASVCCHSRDHTGYIWPLHLDLACEERGLFRAALSSIAYGPFGFRFGHFGEEVGRLHDPSIASFDLKDVKVFWQTNCSVTQPICSLSFADEFPAADVVAKDLQHTSMDRLASG